MNVCFRVSCVTVAVFFIHSGARASNLYYQNFYNTSGLTLVGSANNSATSGQLQIVPSARNQAGAAYSTTPVELGLNATFSTQFQFQFTNPGGRDPADGITFVLAANPNGLGGYGIGMGYAGVPNSLAIEFDTYNNSGYGIPHDDGNSSNHVAIDMNGMLSNEGIANVYGNNSCGFPGGIPSQNMYTAPGCMSNGQVWTVDISYNGSNNLLNVSLSNPLEKSTFYALNNYYIDMEKILGTNKAYVGFTGSTGAGWENENIIKWAFSDTAVVPNISNVPEPVTSALLGAGLLGLGLVRRRRPA